MHIFWQNKVQTLTEAFLEIHQKEHKKFLKLLNKINNITGDFHCDHRVIVSGHNDNIGDITNILQHLKPWRKGPFLVFNQFIDSEWQCNLKYERLKQHINFYKKNILDVGCGNGYYMFKMFFDGAARVIGLDPSLLSYQQFLTINTFLKLPIQSYTTSLEEMDEDASFDIVLSMGVLYHRRNPIEHLILLKRQLSNDGILVLETLIINDDNQNVLMPEHRYAKMANVWFIPSIELLKTWLLRVGFKQVECVNITKTTVTEQRKTQWTNDESLEDFLDKQNSNLTIEGYQAPTRAIFVARMR